MSKSERAWAPAFGPPDYARKGRIWKDAHLDHVVVVTQPQGRAKLSPNGAQPKRPQVSIAKLPERSTLRLHDAWISIEQRVGSDEPGL